MHGRRIAVAHLLAFVVVTCAALFLLVRYLLVVSAAGESQRSAACLALDGQPLRAQAPEFALPDLAGAVQRLSAYRGRVVLLNFWATWCPPCVEELPSLVALARTLATEGRDSALITVSVDDSAQVVQEFLQGRREQLGALPVLLDPNRATPGAYGTEKFPESYLIDREGLVRYRFINKRDWASPQALACLRSLR